MEIKLGLDLLEDKRIEKNFTNKKFIEKVFHPSEIKRPEKLASVFSLKEAVFKALDISSENWLEIEVSYSNTGKPKMFLSEEIKPKSLVSIACSVSHEKGMTQAAVVLLLNEEQ